MSITVTLATQINILDTQTGTYVNSGDATITTNGMNYTATFTASTTPPVSGYASYQKAMSGGAATIDLTVLPAPVGSGNVTLTGLKVQCMKLRNLAANANNITVTFGAANPYLLLGAAFLFILAPGQEITIYGNNATPTIDATHKNIDISGTAAQILEVTVVAG